MRRVFSCGIVTFLVAIFTGLLAHATTRPNNTETLTYGTFARLCQRILNGASVSEIEDTLPGLAANLTIAREVSRRHWTDSTPFDELANAYVLPERVLDALGIEHSATGGIVHAPAGTMHTYGYLFSQLQTSFGLKSKRWIESRIDERLGLPAGSFSPLAPKGEFLSNLTVTLSRLVGEELMLEHAFDARPRAKLEGHARQLVKWRTPDGKIVEAAVDIHLVELKKLRDLETKDVKLLIYSVVSSDGSRRFVTAFPVEESFAAAIAAAAPGIERGFKPRFNLYVDPAWTVLENRSLGFVRSR